ncbi:TetR/AcrR family transcriptional regulator [Puia sp. P3]|uniref:TetR/AcrR family transcriptional regulator n=1 Tax=Puia sp. P3 TaxID=3423952 RepID=UPI003D67AD69
MKETKEHIIELADELIRKRGFNAFSYSDIAGPLAVRNAAIHYYFPSKSDLGEAVIDQELQRVDEYRRKSERLGGEEQPKLLVGVFRRNNKLRLICLMGSLTPDYDTFEEPMRQKVKEMCTGILDWLGEALERAREEGGLQFEGSAGDRALLVVSTLLSSLLLSRVLGANIFEQMLDQLLRDMRADWQVKDIKL